MDYLTLKSNNMDYLSGAAKPTSLDYLSAYATMLDRTRLYFQGLPQLREAIPPPMLAAHGARGERGEIPLDLSMKTIRQTPDSTATDDDVIVLDHKKAAAARAHALSKLHAEAARHGARFSEAYLPQGATFTNVANSATSKKCQHNANLALLGLGAYGGGEMLVPPPHLAGHLGLAGCAADATGGAMCIDFPRCRDLMVPTSLGLHPLHRAQGLQAVPLGGMHTLNVQAAYAEQQRNALNKMIPLCPTQNNGGPMPQDVAGLNELHRLSLAANTGGFLVPPSCVMPMATSKMVRDRYPMPTPGYPKENACPCCPPTGLPIPCACCIPKQQPATRSGAFTTYGDSCCPGKDLPFTSHIQQTLHNSASKECKDAMKIKDSRHVKKEMRHSIMVANNKNIVKEMTYPKGVSTPPARPTPATPPEASAAPPSPDGCARTDGRDKHSIQRDAERCRLSLIDGMPTTATRVYAPVASIPAAPANERASDAKNPTEAATPKDAPLPSGGVAANNEFEVVQCTEGSPSPAKAEEAAAATVRRNTATVWRPGGNWDDEDEADAKAKEAAIPTTVKDKAAPAQMVQGCTVEKASATFVEELVYKYRKRYAENRALQRLLLSIKRPKPPTCSGAMLTYLMGGAAEAKRKRRTEDADDQENPKKIKSADEECSPMESSVKTYGRVRRHEKRSKDKRLENIRKKRHERIQKIIIKVRDAEEKKKEEEEELDKVEKLIVRLYYGRRRLLGHHRRRPVTDAMRLKRRSLKRIIPQRRNNIASQQRHHSNKVSPTMVAPIEMKRLMINKTLGETLLHRAARQGYSEVVMYCLTTNYVDVDAKDNAGYTPLHECCARGHLQIARYLLQYGADVNASAAGGIRPIHDAVENDHVEVVRLLLSYGADPLLATYSGLTPIKIAHSRTMIDLISGFLADVSGDSTEATSPWLFQGAARFFDSPESGFDIFDDLPSDSEDADENDITFEISDTPHVRTYLLTTPGCNSPEVFCLLDEVLQKTGQTRDELIKCYPSARFTSMTSSEFLRMVERSQVSIGVSFNTEEVVHLIKLDDVLRQLLGVETVVISTSEN